MTRQYDRDFFELKEGESVVVIKTLEDGSLQSVTLGKIEGGRGFSPEMKHLEAYHGLFKLADMFYMCDRCGRPLRTLDHGIIKIAIKDLEEYNFCSFECGTKVEQEYKKQKKLFEGLKK